MTKKLILALILPFLTISSLFADFFAFRKLTDPKTGNVVYLLYDMHLSVNTNPKKTESMMQELYELINLECENNSNQSSFLQDAEKIVLKIRKNFNCSKQQEDLINAIRKYNISIIDEDASPAIEYHVEKPLLKILYNPYDIRTWLPTLFACYKKFTKKSFAKEKSLGKFIAYSLISLGSDQQYHTLSIRDQTPIIGMSKIFTGSSDIMQFKPIQNTTAYFYNADFRMATWFQGRNDDIKVNTVTLEAIDKLFSEYKQSKVIVSEGAAHIVSIAKELIDKGYVADDLVISDTLQEKRKKHAFIDECIKLLEKNDYETLWKEDEDWKPEKNQSDDKETITTIKYDEALCNCIVEDPLDLKAIFEKEFEKNVKKKDIIKQAKMKSNQKNKKFVHTFLKHYGSICFKNSPQLHKNVIKAVTKEIA